MRLHVRGTGSAGLMGDLVARLGRAAMPHDAEPQGSQDSELVVNMVRNPGNAPIHGRGRGAFYPVLGAAELPARSRYTTGKRNTQKIERKHLTLRTRIKRLVRKTICFSKTIQMHDIVLGLFVNRYAFGLQV